MSVSTMIKQAEKSLGWGEPNPIHSWYGNRNGSYFKNGSTPWCNMAITYWAYHSGNYDAVCFGKDYAYTVYHAQEFQRRGRWHYGTDGIQPGDIIFFQWEGGSRSIGKIDHVGLVYKVTSSYIYCIEGNTGNRCVRKTRGKNSLVCGYGRPAYTGGGKVTNVSSSKAMTTFRSVKDQQKAVNDLGYSPKLVVDGIYGPKTEAGVKWLQKRVGCTMIDGEWGPETEKLYKKFTSKGQPAAPKTDAPPYPGYYFVYRGPNVPLKYNAQVKKWQQRMKDLGYSLAVDGYYGPESRGVCLKFQRAVFSQSKDHDGVVGPRTWAKSWD